MGIIKKIDEFIEERTLQRKGLPERVVFMLYEWEDFKKELEDSP